MSRKWWVLASVACGTFMATMDSSIVNIALPTMTKSLNTDLAHVKWVVIVYFLFITCLLLPFGRMSDLVGRKKVFGLGFLIFTGGSALCGLSWNLGWLTFARMIQAMGASMLMANGPAIITAAFPAKERGGALGTLAMVVSAGLILGPSIGGLLVAELGWRSIFLVNVPFGLLGIFLVHKHVEESMAPLATRLKLSKDFDWPGTILQGVLILIFIILFDRPTGAQTIPLSVSRVLLLIALAGTVFWFIKVESKAKAPIFDFTLLRSKTFWTANLASFLMFFAYSSILVLMPFFLEEVMFYRTKAAGLYMTFMPLTILIVAPLAGRLSDRLGSLELCFAGALVIVVTLVTMSGIFGRGIHEDSSTLSIILALCAMGLGLGLFQSPNNNAIMSAVPHSKLGSASALIATLRNLGLVTGTGFATGVFTWRHQASGDFVSALHFTFLLAGIIGIGAVASSLGKPKGPHWSA